MNVCKTLRGGYDSDITAAAAAAAGGAGADTPRGRAV